MKFINKIQNISECYPKGAFDLTAWRAYTKDISNELSEKCEQDASDYDFTSEVLPVLNQVVINLDKVDAADKAFDDVATSLKQNLNALFHKEIDLDIILYLGMCNGAGWATTLGNKNVILLGIEKIIELNWHKKPKMKALIYHEIGHIWHKTYGVLYPNTSSRAEDSLTQLYREGIAMVCEQILCNGNNYYHQNKNGWLEWCQSNKAEIKREYLRRMNAHESTQDFFGDWCSYLGYSDVGYFLGCDFIRFLTKQYELTEIASLNIKVLLQRFIVYVTE